MALSKSVGGRPRTVSDSFTIGKGSLNAEFAECTEAGNAEVAKAGNAVFDTECTEMTPRARRKTPTMATPATCLINSDCL